VRARVVIRRMTGRQTNWVVSYDVDEAELRLVRNMRPRR